MIGFHFYRREASFLAPARRSTYILPLDITLWNLLEVARNDVSLHLLFKNGSTFAYQLQHIVSNLHLAFD